MLKNKNHKLAVTLLSGLWLLAWPLSLWAVDFSFDPSNTLKDGTGLGDQDPVIIVGYIINWVLSLLGVASLVLIIYAGGRWMFARGNEEEVTKAKEIIKAAVIGLAIILASYGLAQYVFNKLVSMTL